MILYGHDPTVAEWVGKINGRAFEPPYAAFGVIDREGTLTGGCVFTGFNGDSICFSMAGRAALSREALRETIRYVFDQLGCARLETNTRRSNKLTRKHAPRLGLKFEGVARRYYGQEDGIRHSLTIDDLPAFKRRWKL